MESGGFKADDLRVEVERLRRHQAAIVRLARRGGGTGREVDALLREVTEVAGLTLDVERSSVWMLSDDGEELRCLDLYEATSGTHSRGTTLSARQYARYFEALETGRAIDAHDASSDPRTSEFGEGYLLPLGIRSMLDAAIRREGAVVGVVCFEHVGPLRKWTADEVSFAGAVADQVALIFADAHRRHLEAERERLHQAMLRTQKLESLARLAGGLAHDLGNVFTVILGNASNARDALGPGPEREALDEVIVNAQRASQFARLLLAYAGRQPVAIRHVDLSRQVRGAAAFLRRAIPPDVCLTLKLAEDLPSIEADAAQIQQVAIALLQNAFEAIGNRDGDVLVTTHRHEMGPQDRGELLVGEDVPPGAYVCLEIQDDGCGFDEEIRARLFDPFFTTKGTGRGLGLAAVLGIVGSHRGAIEARGSAGRGAIFRIYFPAGAAPAEARPPEALAPPKAGRRKRTILVIDEEEAVRATAARSLARAGHEVLLAADGHEGLALFEKRNAEIDVVVLDVTMHDSSSTETYYHLLKISPAARVILSSGYDVEEASRGLMPRGLAGLLQKPYLPEALLAKVDAVLAEEEAPG